jgi:hypothetical protein
MRFLVDTNLLVYAVNRIMTADVDFRKFTFLTVTDPVHSHG